MIEKESTRAQTGSWSSRRSRCSRLPAARRPAPRPRRARLRRAPRHRAQAAPRPRPRRARRAQYKIGYSNAGGVGNGFREEQVCTAKAEALSVRPGLRAHRPSTATPTRPVSSQDIRDLIAADVDAIVFNPNDPAALNPALAEAKAAGIETVSVDAYVTDPDTYNLYNNQEQYAYLGAKWLFEQLGGKGNVWYMRGIAGNPADTDRDTGFKKALAENPDIKVVPSAEGVHTDWDPAKATQIANDFMASGGYDTSRASGRPAWTRRSSTPSRPPASRTCRSSAPTSARSSASSLNATDYAGLKGAAVTNTAAVGGAGVGLALKLLNGETIETAPAPARPNTVLLEPVVADNVTDEGKALLESWKVDGLDPLWPLGLQIEGWTTYTPEQAVACKGPGE